MRPRLYALIAVVLIIAVLALYAYLIEPNEVTVTKLTITCLCPKCVKGGTITIVQLTDLHIHEFGVREQRVIDLVCRLKPDILVFTGDMIDDHKCLGLFKTFVRKLVKCVPPSRIYAVPGNWEYFSNSTEDYVEFLKGLGAHVLLNNAIKVRIDGVYLWIAGTDDMIAGNYDMGKALSAVNDDWPIVVLAHEPCVVYDVVKYGRGKDVCIVLTGHTHGGQVELPLIGPIYLPPKSCGFVNGLYNVSGVVMYVSRGIGVHRIFPFRLNCPPEVVYVKLRLQPPVISS